jgi:hypothetical protein
MAKKKFPTFPVILLVVGILWLLVELGLITIRIPWIPIVLIIVAAGWIWKSYQ